MGSPSIPAQPAPPDYAAANREGIQTDIETLPTRRLIEQAARLGKKVDYVDAKTGETKTADFSNMGDDQYAAQMAAILGQSNVDLQRSQLKLRQELGAANAEQTAKELEAADPKGWNARQQVMDRVVRDMNMGPATVSPSGNIASAENRLWNEANSAPKADGRVNELANQLTARDDRTNQLLQAAGQRDARIDDVYAQAMRLPGEVADPTTGVLNQGLQQALAEYKLGGKLDDASRRDLLNDVRAGQASRGNYLGDAAAVVEATELGQAGNQLKQQRLANLLDIQNRAFGQNTTLRQEGTQNLQNRLGTMASLQGQDFGQRTSQIGQMAGLVGQDIGQNSSRIGQLSSLLGQDFGQRQQAYQTGLNAAQAAFQGTQAMANDQRAARQEGFGYDQQRLANAQSAALGSPLSNQFGNLGGAQNGAVGFTPVNFQGGMGVNQNAGAQAANFAQGNYGTQAGMWGTQAQIAAQGNPWMSLLGTGIGAMTGGFGAALGGSLGPKK